MTGPRNPEKDPAEWTTGEELPEDLTKAEASKLIDRLQEKTGRGATTWTAPAAPHEGRTRAGEGGTRRRGTRTRARKRGPRARTSAELAHRNVELTPRNVELGPGEWDSRVFGEICARRREFCFYRSCGRTSVANRVTLVSTRSRSPVPSTIRMVCSIPVRSTAAARRSAHERALPTGCRRHRNSV